MTTIYEESWSTISGEAPQPQLTLLEGGPLSGKTSAALSFVKDALVREEACCLVTTDPPEHSIAILERVLRFDPTSALQDERLTIARYGRCFADKLRARGSPAHALDEICRLVEKRGIERLAIDTVEPLLAACPPEDAKSFIGDLCSGLRSLGGATLLVSLSIPNDDFCLSRAVLAAKVDRALRLESVQKGGLVLVESSAHLPARLGLVGADS